MTWVVRGGAPRYDAGEPSVARRSSISVASIGLASLGGLGGVACAPKFYAPHPCDRPDLTGCLVDEVKVVGARRVPPGDIKGKIATAETSRALAGVLEHVPIASLWDRITVDYEELDPFVLERDLQRIERLFKARGFYEARARAARVRKAGEPGEERAYVEIVVEEGPAVLLKSAKIVWKGEAPQRALARTKLAMGGLKLDAPFEEGPFEDVKQKLARAMTDRGFAYAKVEAKARVDLVTHRADVTYTIDPGPPTTFGRITVEGAGNLPVERILLVIDIREGRSFSTALLEKAQTALGDLRVFGSVDALPQLSKEGEARVTEVPVVFRVTPTTLRTTKLGFGVEAGTRVAFHGVAGWENRNFLGGLRFFTVEAKPGVVVNPLAIYGRSTSAPYGAVPELRLHASLQQPGFVEARMRGLVNADVNMTQLQPGYTLGYFELAGKTGVERDLWSGRVHLGLSLNTQIDTPLNLQIPGLSMASNCGGFHTLVIPYLQSTFALDLRRDQDGKRNALMPAHSGFYLSNDVQFAWGPGSRDIRVRPEARAYIPLSKRVTLAMRLGVGVLHAFGGTLTQEPSAPYSGLESDWKIDGKGCVVPSDPALTTPLSPGQVERSQWLQVLQLRGFYSGGTNSNRGYGYAGVGPQEPIPAISPVNHGILLPIATGGLAMWEASVELRFPIYDKLGMTVFVDASDVRQVLADFFQDTTASSDNMLTNVRFAPHLSAGLGIRYATPVGPLRADVALRIPGAQVLGTTCSVYDSSVVTPANAVWAPWGDPPSGKCYILPDYGQSGSFAGIPLAVSLAIGEAY